MKCNYDILYGIVLASCDKKCCSEHQTPLSAFQEGLGTTRLGRFVCQNADFARYISFTVLYWELVAAELLNEPISVPLECIRGALALVRDALKSDSP